MTVKRGLSLALMISILMFMSACAKTPGVTEEVACTNIDKYRCVAFYSMLDSDDSSAVTIENLNPIAASKFAILQDPSLGERKVVGEAKMCDGTNANHDVSFAEGEYVATVGTSFEGDVAILKEVTKGDESKSLVELIGKDGRTTKELTISGEYSFIPGSSEVYVDAQELVHLTNIVKLESDNQYSYIVIKDGKEVYCRELLDKRNPSKLLFLPDMSVAVDIVDSKSEGRVNHEIVKFGVDNSSCLTLCQYSTADVITGEEIVALNIFDESHLVYLTCYGVYMSDYKLKKAELVFDWHKNGVSFNSAISYFEEYKVCANNTGDILILKEGFRCDEFLKLSKLPENMVTVEIAGIGGNRSYSQAVFDFNIKHPEYHISIRDDIDRTNLISRMTAGDGPEIIEAGVVDVQALEKVWEPLESFVSTDIIDNLNKGAVTCGSINGELYGAAASYTIDTLITGEDLESWDYESFINAIETNHGLETITGTALLDGKFLAFEYLFCDGIDETYFINPKGENGVIDHEKLEKVLSIIEKYQNSGNYERESYDMLADKSMLCARFLVSRPIDLYSIYYAAGDVGKIIGYPGKAGSKHYLNSSGTLFVRKNIAAEKRELISEFFKYMLSYEGQKNIFINSINEGFSARDDVLNEQIDDLKNREGERAGLGSVMFTFENIDTEAAKEELKEIMDNSLPIRDWNNPLYDILWEEFGSYFAGNIDVNALEDHLNNRIRIYIEEMK